MANEEEYILLLPEHLKPLYTNTGLLKTLFIGVPEHPPMFLEGSTFSTLLDCSCCLTNI